jgi:hypothetical protein
MMSPSLLLQIIQLWLSNYDVHKPDEKQMATIFDERLPDLEEAMSHISESTQHLQALRSNAYQMYMASKEQNVDEGKRARKAALSACGFLQEIRVKNNLA